MEMETQMTMMMKMTMKLVLLTKERTSHIF